MTKEVFKDMALEGAKASPPVAVVAASLTSGWTMGHTLTALTIFYVVLQIAWLIWRWHQAATKGKLVEAE